MAEGPNARMREEEGLRALFRDLRSEEERLAPDFRRVLEGARGRLDARGENGGTSGLVSAHARQGGQGLWFKHRLGWAGGLLAAAALAGVLLLSRSPASSEADFERAVRAFSADPAGGAWRSPTDALLRLPGDDLLRTRPRVGGSRWPGVTGTPFGTTSR